MISSQFSPGFNFYFGLIRRVCRKAGKFRSWQERLRAAFRRPSWPSQNFLEGREAAFVFRLGADGDADPLGQLIATERADNDALFLQIGEDALAVADAH